MFVFDSFTEINVAVDTGRRSGCHHIPRWGILPLRTTPCEDEEWAGVVEGPLVVFSGNPFRGLAFSNLRGGDGEIQGALARIFPSLFPSQDGHQWIRESH